MRGARHTPGGRARRGTAALLLAKLIASCHVTVEQLSHELAVTPEKLREYESGRVEMPLNRQARLALFVIASVPGFVADGNRLRQQVAAAIAFRSRETATHESPLR